LPCTLVVADRGDGRAAHLSGAALSFRDQIDITEHAGVVHPAEPLALRNFPPQIRQPSVEIQTEEGRGLRTKHLGRHQTSELRNKVVDDWEVI